MINKNHLPAQVNFMLSKILIFRKDYLSNRTCKMQFNTTKQFIQCLLGFHQWFCTAKWWAFTITLRATHGLSGGIQINMFYGYNPLQVATIKKIHNKAKNQICRNSSNIEKLNGRQRQNR